PPQPASSGPRLGGGAAAGARRREGRQPRRRRGGGPPPGPPVRGGRSPHPRRRQRQEAEPGQPVPEVLPPAEAGRAAVALAHPAERGALRRGPAARVAVDAHARPPLRSAQTKVVPQASMLQGSYLRSPAVSP